MAALDRFLRTLPGLLSLACLRCDRRHGRGGRKAQPPARRISARTSLSARTLRRLLTRLDCDRDGISLRTGKPAWPDSWPLSLCLCQRLGAERWLVPILAAWLEGLAPTTRRTYSAITAEALRELRITTVAALVRLPEQAALTWQRDLARHRLPRTANTATACLNSLMAHLARLAVFPGLSWSPIPALKVTKGRWIDRDPVVLSAEQLLQFWATAAQRPSRQFLALMLASLHGLRASEVAGLRWGDVRHSRRGKHSAPAVLHVVGKGRKHRVVQVHQALRRWIERQRIGQDPGAYVLADSAGAAPSPQVVSWWAKDVFRRAALTGYAHALRATWVTLALEHQGNNALQVQQSGGWRDQATMLGHYFKRRKIAAIRLFPESGRY